jgi:hypothetical protein
VINTAIWNFPYCVRVRMQIELADALNVIGRCVIGRASREYRASELGCGAEWPSAPGQRDRPGDTHGRIARRRCLPGDRGRSSSYDTDRIDDELDD